MLFKFTCPHCLKDVKADDKYVGRTAPCPRCSQKLVIPAPSDSLLVPKLPPTPLEVPIESASSPSEAPPQQPKAVFITQESTHSSLSTTSLVFGIISFIGVPLCGLIALFTGFNSLGKINRSNGELSGKGMSIAGIIFGFWSIVRIIIIVTILLPALVKAREKSGEVICINSLKIIGIATLIYASDHGDKLPASIDDLIAGKYLNQDQKYHSTSTKIIPSNAKDEYKFQPAVINKMPAGSNEQLHIPLIICNKHKYHDIILYVNGRVEQRLKQSKDKP